VLRPRVGNVAAALLCANVCSTHFLHGFRRSRRPERSGRGGFRLGSREPGKAAGSLRTGLRGETYAYWYLRRHGYVLVARNFTAPGLKGEIDMVGYDGPVFAFVQVKTRTKMEHSEKFPALQATPESAVNIEKPRNISRVAQQFLRARHIESTDCRFNVLAIESRRGPKPVVRNAQGRIQRRRTAATTGIVRVWNSNCHRKQRIEILGSRIEV